MVQRRFCDVCGSEIKTRKWLEVRMFRKERDFGMVMEVFDKDVCSGRCLMKLAEEVNVDG